MERYCSIFHNIGDLAQTYLRFNSGSNSPKAWEVSDLSPEHRRHRHGPAQAETGIIVGHARPSASGVRDPATWVADDARCLSLSVLVTVGKTRSGTWTARALVRLVQSRPAHMPQTSFARGTEGPTPISRTPPRVQRTSLVSAAGGYWKCIPRKVPAFELDATLACAIMGFSRCALNSF